MSAIYNTHLPPPLHLKLFHLSFEHDLGLPTTYKGRRGITSTRSWAGHSSQNKVQCLKYFCKVVAHIAGAILVSVV